MAEFGASGERINDGSAHSARSGDGHAHGSGNPHYWLDPKNAEFITANILAGLARIDPAHASTYEANRDAFLARLGQKIGEWDKRLAPLKSMPIIAYHNSWPYFARRFRLCQRNRMLKMLTECN